MKWTCSLRGHHLFPMYSVLQTQVVAQELEGLTVSEICLFSLHRVIFWSSHTDFVNSIPPIQQESMKNGYDENKAYNEER